MAHGNFPESPEVARDVCQQPVVVSDAVVAVNCYYYCDHFILKFRLLWLGVGHIPKERSQRR